MSSAVCTNSNCRAAANKCDGSEEESSSTVLFNSSASSDKVGGKSKSLRRKKRIKKTKAGSEASEHRHYQFMLCNYLLFKSGHLSEDMKKDLDDLDSQWITHVEQQEGIPKHLRKLPMPDKVAIAYALRELNDNRELFLMFIKMMKEPK